MHQVQLRHPAQRLFSERTSALLDGETMVHLPHNYVKAGVAKRLAYFGLRRHERRRERQVLREIVARVDDFLYVAQGPRNSHEVS